MDRNQIIDLLTVIVACDRRTTGDADISAWQATVGDLPFRDARDAVVAHYRESTKWIMPADVRRGVAEIRKRRIEAAPPVEIPEHLADRPIEARDWKQRTLTAIADGVDPQLAIGSGQ